MIFMNNPNDISEAGISGWGKLFDLHANLFRQIPGNSDKIRNGNINVPKQNDEIPVIPDLQFHQHLS